MNLRTGKIKFQTLKPSSEGSIEGPLFSETKSATGKKLVLTGR